MSDRETITMAPCPFCGGPPCIDYELEAFNDETGIRKIKQLADRVPKDYVTCEARVWCHECGAKGPAAQDPTVGGYPSVCNEDDILQVEFMAIEAWNNRNSRHIALYVGGFTEGLQQHPRPEGWEAIARVDREIRDLEERRDLLAKEPRG